MKKVIVFVLMFAFVLAGAPAVDAASSASSGSSSSGSSSARRASSNSGNADANVGQVVITPGADDVNQVPGPIKTPSPIKNPVKAPDLGSDVVNPPLPCKTVTCKQAKVTPPRTSRGKRGGSQVTTGVPVTAAVVTVLPYADGSVLRDTSTKRIYLVAGKTLRPVRTLADLAMLKGRKTVDVASSVIGLYQLDTAKHTYFKDGTLVRNAANHKIYVADKCRLKAVTSMNDLKTVHKGKTIKNVDPTAIATY